MGSCFSRCRPRRQYSMEDHGGRQSHECDSNTPVQDKLVITSQAPNRTPLCHGHYNKISPSPASPTKSSSSSSSSSFSSSANSFACANSKPSSSSCSSCLSSSTSTATLTSKDRCFSNEFLWSCAKENSHILQISSIKKANALPSLHADKFPNTEEELESPARQSPIIAAAMKRTVIPPDPAPAWKNTTQKRARASSPSLIVRQKSFRSSVDEPDGIRFYGAGVHSNFPRKTLLRSPSPSRRFEGGDKCRSISVTTAKVSSTPRDAMSSNVPRKENNNAPMRPSSPKNNNPNNCQTLRPSLLNRETLSQHQIGSRRVDGIAQKVLAEHDVNMVEDLDNPLISLDCFIFI